jgi:hypothetical protein
MGKKKIHKFPQAAQIFCIVWRTPQCEQYFNVGLNWTPSYLLFNGWLDGWMKKASRPRRPLLYVMYLTCMNNRGVSLLLIYLSHFNPQIKRGLERL